MAKNQIADWDATPGNNSDLAGINIAEGCPASGINDALRALMSQMAAWIVSTTGPVIKIAGGLIANAQQVADGAGTGRGIGYRSLPTSRSVSAAATLAASDEGMAIKSSAGGLTIPANATVSLAVDGLFAFYNMSDSAQTISFASGVTGRLAGGTTTGARTVAARGTAFLWKVNTDEWSCSGSVS